MCTTFSASCLDTRGVSHCSERMRALASSRCSSFDHARASISGSTNTLTKRKHSGCSPYFLALAAFFLTDTWWTLIASRCFLLLSVCEAPALVMCAEQQKYENFCTFAPGKRACKLPFFAQPSRQQTLGMPPLPIVSPVNLLPLPPRTFPLSFPSFLPAPNQSSVLRLRRVLT